jgi:Fe2+ transport system protein FeoA
MVCLDQLKPTQTGRVVKVSGGREIKRRLLDLGIRRGEIVGMVKAAPLQDPLEVSFGFGHLSIRRSDAALVLVEVLSDESGAAE